MNAKSSLIGQYCIIKRYPLSKVFELSNSKPICLKMLMECYKLEEEHIMLNMCSIL